jgi:D-psicose/D-tagatose/L-ribulose 3-epimerase
MNNLAIHSYCLIPAWTTADGERALAKAAAAGYGVVVVPLKTHAAIEPDKVARMFERFGLRPVCSATQLPDANIASTDRTVWAAGLARHRTSLALARDLGARHVGGIIYSLFGKATGPASPEMFAASAEGISRLAEDAAVSGMRLALEVVNRYETNLINTVDQGLEMLRLVGAKNVHLHLDTFHMAIEENDPLAALEKALPHLAYFELDQNHRGRLDRGTIDFAPMLALLRRADYRDLIGVEAFSGAVSGPETAAGVGAWRNMFDDGTEVADSGIAVLRRAGWLA